jgi:hypothetical protein
MISNFSGALRDDTGENYGIPADGIPGRWLTHGREDHSDEWMPLPWLEIK